MKKTMIQVDILLL